MTTFLIFGAVYAASALYNYKTIQREEKRPDYNDFLLCFVPMVNTVFSIMHLVISNYYDQNGSSDNFWRKCFGIKG